MMTRAPCRVLRGARRVPTDNLRQWTWFRGGSRVGHVRRAPVTTSGAPRPTHSHEATGTDRRSWCRRPFHRTEPGRTPLTPGPVVDERLPPAGPVSTVERQSLSSRNHSMETPPCA